MQKSNLFTKKVFLIILFSISYFFTFYTNIKAEDKIVYLDYEISKDAKNSDCLVKFSFDGNSSGKTDIITGHSNQKDLSAVSSDGKNLKSNLWINKKNNEVIFTIKHKPKERITMHYRVTQDVNSERIITGGTNSDSNNYFICDIFNFLNYPQLNHPKNIKVSLNFKNFSFESKVIFINNKIQNLKKGEFYNLKDLKDKLIIFTNKSIGVYKSENDFGSLNFITFGFSEKDNTKIEDMIINAKKIILNNGKFIHKIAPNLTLPKYNNILLFNYSVIAGNNFFGGIHLHNSRDIIINFDKNDYEKNILDAFKNTFSHEYLHHLFNINFHVNFGINDGFWFREGITEYYANLLNYRAGIISEKEYLKNLNQAISNYSFMKEMQNLAGELGDPFQTYFISEFSKNNSYVFLYDMGHLTALDMDNMIQNRNNGEMNLEKMLANLYRKNCKSKKCTISKEQFNKEFKLTIKSKRNDNNFEYIEKYIEKFQPIVLPSDIFNGKFKLKYKNGFTYDNYSFDPVKSFCSGLISILKKDYKIYKCGLRENMKMTFLGLENNLKENSAFMIIKAEGPNSEMYECKIDLKRNGLVPYYS